MVMRPEGASAALDRLEPALRAAARNVLRQAYGPDGLPWGTRLDQAEGFAVRVAERLTRLILEVGLQQQADRPLPDELQACPGCGQPVEPQPPPPRPLRPAAGDIPCPQP